MYVLVHFSPLSNGRCSFFNELFFTLLLEFFSPCISFDKKTIFWPFKLLVMGAKRSLDLPYLHLDCRSYSVTE
jgi:hypothetical protein